MAEMIAGSEIRSDTVPILVHGIFHKGETGNLILRQDPIVKTLQFERGTITFASSNDRDDRFAEVLLRRGLVSLPNLMESLDVALRTKQRLGEVLLPRKMISQADLERALQEHLKEMVFSVFAWTAGSWQFDKGAPKHDEKITLKIHPLALVLEGVRRIPSWVRVYEVVGGLNTEYRTTREASALAEKADLMAGERQILAFCEKTRTLSEICDSMPMNGFVLCKVVWGLLIVGALMKA